MKFIRNIDNKNIVMVDYELHEDYYAGTLVEMGHADDTPLRVGEYREDWAKDKHEVITDEFSITLTNYTTQNEDQDKVKLKMP
jgi:hypothetical protein